MGESDPRQKKTTETASEAGVREASSGEPDIKARSELMGIYQERLNHEYDKGWEQVRITAYISGGILAVTGFLFRAFPESNIFILLRALCGIGFCVALGSLINQIGSQLDARDLRRTLARLEDPMCPYYAKRTSLIGPAGVGLLLISVCMTAFWLAAWFGAPNVIKGGTPVTSPGHPIPIDSDSGDDAPKKK